jgi:hypothetical protein
LAKTESAYGDFAVWAAAGSENKEPHHNPPMAAKAIH